MLKSVFMIRMVNVLKLFIRNHCLNAKNYQKQKKKVAKLHNKIKYQRLDNLQKVSTEIIKNHDYIVLETFKN